MRNNWDIVSHYRGWLQDLVDDRQHSLDHYSIMMDTLFSIPFEWDLPLDENRAIDGLALRSRFDREMRFSNAVKTRLDGVDCTVLEMLIALSERCYNEFLSGISDKKLSPGYIFMEMLDNLGVLEDDKNGQKEEKVTKIYHKVIKWQHKKYTKNGKNSIFLVKNYDGDLRKLEIWWQMQRYLDENWPI